MSSTTTTTTNEGSLNFWPAKHGTVRISPNMADNLSMKFDERVVDITDVRGGLESELKLDTAGFEFFKAPLVCSEFGSFADVKKHYYKEIEDLVAKVTGASRVLCYFHQIRESPDDSAKEGGEQGPVSFVHCDYTEQGGWMKIANTADFPDRVQLLKSRWASFSVWRPLKEVTRDNLGMCDSRTSGDSDAQACPITFPTGELCETAMYRYSDGQKWYYKSSMDTDDVVLIKIFESKKDGRARFAPHSAFTAPSDHGEGRRSIEVRCFAFWEDQSLE